MIFTWYKVINKNDFDALDIPSKQIEVILENIGLSRVLVCKGIHTSILYDGVFLTIGLNDENPFVIDGHAVYLDENDDIFLGIEVDEE